MTIRPDKVKNTMPPPVLVATLGLQPQIITRALDQMLTAIAPDLGALFLVHTSSFPRNHPHWQSLGQFEAYLQQTYPPLTIEMVPIREADGRIVRDVETPDTAELAFRVIFRVMRNLKREGYPLHALIAGGRKSMIVYTMISAQLLFDEADQLWHLFSTVETPDPHVTAANSEKSHLIEIPILHLAGLMPMVRELILNSEDPTLAARLYRKHENVEQVVRIERFYRAECDELDRQILHLAYQGLTNREIGQKIALSEAAVNNRISKMARSFYKPPYFPRPLRPWPTHIRLRLLEDLRPYLTTLGDK